jgi:hypothetical protein
MGTRTKAIERKLREVHALPAAESQQVLPDIASDALDMETDEDERESIN